MAVFGRKPEEQEWSRTRPAVPREREEPSAQPAGEVTPHPAPAAPPVPNPLAQPSATAGPITRLPMSADATPQRGTRPLHADVQDMETLIGERTSFEGTLRCEGSLRILGSVQGEVDSKGTIIIEERAQVKATVRGANVTVGGRVEGEIHCSGKVEIRPTGRVAGELEAGALVVQEGAVFDGNSRMVGQQEELKDGGRAGAPAGKMVGTERHA